MIGHRSRHFTCACVWCVCAHCIEKKIAINISPKLLLVSQSNLHHSVLRCMCLFVLISFAVWSVVSIAHYFMFFLPLPFWLSAHSRQFGSHFFWMHIIWAVHRLTVNMCCIFGVDSYFFPRLRFFRSPDYFFSFTCSSSSLVYAVRVWCV